MFDSINITRLQLIFRTLCVSLTNILALFLVYYFLVPLIVTSCTTTNCSHFKERVFNYSNDELEDEVFVELKLNCTIKIEKTSNVVFVTLEHTSKFGEIGYIWPCSKENVFEVPYVGLITVILIFIIYIFLAGICIVSQIRNIGIYDNNVSDFLKIDQHDDKNKKIRHGFENNFQMDTVNSTS